MNDTLALKKAVRRTDITLFGPDFNVALTRRVTEPVDTTQTLGDLLTDVIAQLLKKPMYHEVLDLYKSGDPLTGGYSPICKQALDLYIASLNR